MLDAHVDDLGAILAGDPVQRVLDIVHHLAALGAEQGGEGLAAELVAQRRGEDRPQLVRDVLRGLRRDVHAQRIDDPVAGEGVDLQPLLVGGEHLLVVHPDRLDALVDPDDLLEEGDARGEAGAGLAEGSFGRYLLSTRTGWPKRTITACSVSGTIEKVAATRISSTMTTTLSTIGLRARLGHCAGAPCGWASAGPRRCSSGSGR
jgi:hypothetical protein